MLLLMSGMEGWACTTECKGGTSMSRAAASDVGLINAASNVGLVNNDASCHDKNCLPNNASPRRGGSPTKSRGRTKRQSPS